jgi:hypothetical protein
MADNAGYSITRGVIIILLLAVFAGDVAFLLRMGADVLH